MWLYSAFDEGLAARSALYTQIYARLNEEGIQIPFPQRVVRVQAETANPVIEAEGASVESPDG